MLLSALSESQTRGLACDLFYYFFNNGSAPARGLSLRWLFPEWTARGLPRHHSAGQEMAGLEAAEESSEATMAHSRQEKVVHQTALRHRSGLLAKHSARLGTRREPRSKA